jgi:hypothetical protein
MANSAEVIAFLARGTDRRPEAIHDDAGAVVGWSMDLATPAAILAKPPARNTRPRPRGAGRPRIRRTGSGSSSSSSDPGDPDAAEGDGPPAAARPLPTKLSRRDADAEIVWRAMVAHVHEIGSVLDVIRLPVLSTMTGERIAVAVADNVAMGRVTGASGAGRIRAVPTPDAETTS